MFLVYVSYDYLGASPLHNTVSASNLDNIRDLHVFGINDEDTVASLYQAAMAARILARLEDLIDLDAENSPSFRVTSSCCIVVST
mmetsp:Transcript_27906/g.50882  ORF Transcript_27906/g.50882 Transcript_27906/m.50882 type:complete len:85 (-) Transcript_27906:111-365(-)